MSYQEYTVKVFKDGTRAWYKNGELHRDDGPAVELASGTKAWYQNGKYHRTDGPAVEYVNGDKYWFLEGEEYTEEEFKKKMSSPSCEGKIVEIEGHKYKLTSV